MNRTKEERPVGWVSLAIAFKRTLYTVVSDLRLSIPLRRSFSASLSSCSSPIGLSIASRTAMAAALMIDMTARIAAGFISLVGREDGERTGSGSKDSLIVTESSLCIDTISSVVGLPMEGE